MRTILIGILALVVVSGNTAMAAGYRITRVLDVGPASPVPMLGPLKWSPDGTQLAYFHGGSLRTTDTLGANTEVVRLGLAPIHYEWLSDSEVITHLRAYGSGPGHFNRLVKVDINNGQVEVLEEYTHVPSYQGDGDPNSFSGPYRTVEGNVFYRKNVIHTAKVSAPERTVFPLSAHARGGSALATKDDHILAWSKDDLYIFSGDLRDSTRIASRSDHPLKLTPVANSDLTYYMVHNCICRLTDSVCVALDTFIEEYPTGAAMCDFIHYSFNPVTTEVLFNLVYSDGDQHEEFRIGTFDYVSNEFVILDSLIGKEECEAPAYAPNGRQIAFLSGGWVHILFREENP